ncbi:MAG TPA: hypothetical protein VMC85_01510 [Desulfomonilaceae bacterium]|nr:hypothetical protein [Desulfomonilaceae bacterium]
MKDNKQKGHSVPKKTIAFALAFVFLVLQAGSRTAAAADTITIHGKVTGVGGEPLHALISVNSSTNEFLGSSLSSAAGNYSLQVPQRDGYIIWTQELNDRVQFGADTIPSGYSDLYQYAVPQGNDLAVDLTLQSAGAIWLQTYDLSGQYLFRQDVNNNNWTVAVYPLGTPPTEHPLQYLNHQTNTFWGWRNGSNKNHPVVMIPAGVSVELWIHFQVPGVGDTFIHLDNDGKGYSAKKGEALRVNLLYDAARTEYRILHNQLDQYSTGGYELSDAITQADTKASAALQDAGLKCPAGQMAACTSDAYTVLTDVILSREDAALQVAQQDIEKYRKKDVTVQVLDCSGTAVSGQAVDYQQVSNDFIFGAGWPENSEMAAFKQAGFTGAIEEAWWGEVTSDGSQYNYLDGNFSQVVQQGMNIIMHTGVWITPVSGHYFYPRAIENMTPAQMADLAQQFSTKFTEHYRDRMVIYNAFNEPQNAFYTFHFTMDEVVKIAAASSAGAAQGAPDMPTYINFYNTYLGGDLSWYVNQYNENYPSAEEILKAIVKANVPFNDIGLEFYSGVVPTTDFGIYNDTIEHYGQYGKDVFISEISYGSADDYPTRTSGYQGVWRGGHTDQVQADWARYAYTIAFSKPYVTGVVWVPASDTNTSNDLAGYALFNASGQPRPVVSTISDLIHSWMSTGSGTTDATGSLTWRGFAGNYEARWTAQDGSQQLSKIHIGQNTTNDFILKPSTCSVSATAAAANTLIPTSSLTPKGQTGLILFVGLGIVLGIALLLIGISLVKRKAKEKE